MTNSENRRRLPATARLLARVISDPDKPEVEEQELKLASNNVHAVYSRSMRNGKVLLLSEEETEALGTEDADNAFKDVDTMLQLSPANKVEEPVVTQANVKQFAEDAVAEQLEKIAPNRIQQLIEEIAPFRIANIFANYGRNHVEQVMEAYGPEQIERLIEETVPEKIEGVIEEVVKDRVASRLEELLPDGLETHVSELVRDELQGAFGYAVTRKIRKLIRAELELALAE